MDSIPSTSSTIQAILEGKFQSGKRNCRVCETRRDVGVHFGVFLCSRCSDFFRKSLDDTEAFYNRSCATNKQNCSLSDLERPCSFCRAKKCLSVGLNRNYFQEKSSRYLRENESLLKPQSIGTIDNVELVRLLKKAAVRAKSSKEKHNERGEFAKATLKRSLTKKLQANHEADDYSNDQPPILPPSKSKRVNPDASKLRPILPKLTAESQVVVYQLEFPALETPAIGDFLTQAFSDILDRVNRIRFNNEPAIEEFFETDGIGFVNNFLYNSSERPVCEHWRRIEAHFNDVLCALVKFAKMLPEFDRLPSDDQHVLLSCTLLELLFISSVFFIEEETKKFYLNSGCVYSLPFLANIFSCCSGAGDFYRSLFDFCHKIKDFIVYSDDGERISPQRLGLVLALSLFSPPPDTKLNCEESNQSAFLTRVRSEFDDSDLALSRLLERLSCLQTLTNKHKRMVTSLRDNLGVILAVDVHAELLQL